MERINVVCVGWLIDMSVGVSTYSAQQRTDTSKAAGWRHAWGGRRKRMLFSCGGLLSAFCILLQCFREGGFQSRVPVLEVTFPTNLKASIAAGDPSPVCLELERQLRSDEELRGPRALESTVSSLGVRFEDVDLDAIARHARLLEGEAEATAREDWETRAVLYRVIGELHLCAARSNPMALERAADSHVAAGDTLRAYGDSQAAQRRFRRAIEVLQLTLEAVPSARSEAVGRVRGKVATLESNIQVLERRIERSTVKESQK